MLLEAFSWSTLGSHYRARTVQTCILHWDLSHLLQLCGIELKQLSPKPQKKVWGTTASSGENLQTETLVQEAVEEVGVGRAKLILSFFLFALGFPCGSAGKESTCNSGDLGSIPGLGRSPGEGKGYPLQYSALENSMNYIVHGVEKSQTWLSNFHSLSK